MVILDEDFEYVHSLISLAQQVIGAEIYQTVEIPVYAVPFKREGALQTTSQIGTWCHGCGSQIGRLILRFAANND